MSKLQELIQELCPNGVEYKTLGEVCEISRGIVISKDFIRDNAGEYPVYSSQTENEGCLGFINTFKYDGEYLTWTTDGANAGTVFYRNGRFSITNVCGLLKVIEKNLSSKFLYYALSISAPNYVNRGMGNAKLMSNVMASIKIPIPPLPVQEEIVRILDKFTSLTAELTAELTAALTARRKQYEYYRDALLTKDTKVEMKKLGELCQQISNIKWKNEKNSFQYIDLTSVDRETHEIINTTKIDSSNAPSRAQQIVKENDVLFGTTRPMLKRSTFISKEFDGQICSTGYCVLRPNQEIVKPRYIYHHINSSLFYQYVETHQQGASYPAISDADVKNFAIPLPPLDIQQRIVNVLDNFDAICSDLNIGLPAEIDARKKQYEYYRDLLLTFAERGNTIFTEQNRTEQMR